MQLASSASTSFGSSSLLITPLQVYYDKTIAVLITLVTLIDHPDSDPAAKWETLAGKFYEITGTAPAWEATFNALRDDFGGPRD